MSCFFKGGVAFSEGGFDHMFCMIDAHMSWWLAGCCLHAQCIIYNAGLGFTLSIEKVWQAKRQVLVYIHFEGARCKGHCRGL